MPVLPSRARAALIAASLGLFASILVLFVTSGPIDIGTKSVLWRWFGAGARLRH